MVYGGGKLPSLLVWVIFQKKIMVYFDIYISFTPHMENFLPQPLFQNPGYAPVLSQNEARGLGPPAYASVLW